MTSYPSTTTKHEWSAGGVSTYPLRHPIVGQGRFFRTFKQFIHVIDQESDEFAHVFAIIAQWGIGKSRLAYELISQINGTSRGWYIRTPEGSLSKADLFWGDDDREQYLGLYIRYSQIANEHHNIDNWFGFGLYKALLPLANQVFDGSIQSQIAKEAYNRLLPSGFDETQLAEALEVSANHSDEALYEDPYLVTRLCQAAYDYLKQFGIKYILIALDELETVAESSTYGLEDQDIKHMDGRAIKLLGKAIKEEDPRRKLPWLRYVALCSPAIGDELREIQSTARRFELVELSQNAFADVSDFVKTLAEEERLQENYPKGLVEAAYAMSGGNFGWFNVIMANVDGRLRDLRSERESQKTQSGRAPRVSESVASVDQEISSLSVGDLFDEVVQHTGRVRDHVLDYSAINELRLDRTYLASAQELLYGQLPVPLSTWQSEELNALLSGQNEYGEEIAFRYRQVEWDERAFSDALRAAKFERKQEEWVLPSVGQPLDLQQLLDNFSTYSIYAHTSTDAKDQRNRTPDGKRILLIPLREADFAQLVNFLYPHPAADDAARALWRQFNPDGDIPITETTHIAPSIAMLERLNLRYRKQNQTSIIFRDPDQSSAYEQAIAARKQQTQDEKALEVLTGAMRVLDQNWLYDPISASLGSDLIAITTQTGSRLSGEGGLLNCHALMLHPRKRLILTQVRNIEELENLCERVSNQFSEVGKTPVLAFTTSRNLIDQFEQPTSEVLKRAKTYLLLYQLSSGEEFILHQVGIESTKQQGFQLNIQNFNNNFTGRIGSLQRTLLEEIHRWRRQLHSQGCIAFPLRSTGTLKPEEKQTLFRVCRTLLSKEPPHQVFYRNDEQPFFNESEMLSILQKMKISPNVRSKGFGEDERAMLFSTLDDNAKAELPPFLIQVLNRLLRGQAWTRDIADREWFWGYLWEGAKSKDIFTDWLGLVCDLGFAVNQQDSYVFLERNTLENRITESENWLKTDYPKIVEKMEDVFGEEVRILFSPDQGTETRIALDDHLRLAKQALIQTKKQEEAYPQRADLAEQRSRLLASAKARLELLEAVEKVYWKEEFERLVVDPNSKTLDFRNRQEPLWRRIRRGELSANRVLEVSKRISDRIDELKITIDQQTTGLLYFPASFFKLSLEKIRGILRGSLGVSSPQSSTEKQQMMDAGALGQCLKSLRIGEAMNRLEQLAREVGLQGVDQVSPREMSFDEIDGQIISSFRRFKQAYEILSTQLTEARSDLAKLKEVLTDAPSDFQYPADLPSFDDLEERPEFIEGSLADIGDSEAEALREEPAFDRQAKLGNFKPLMDEVDRLLKVPRQQIVQWSNQIGELENAVKRYYRSLLNAPDIQRIEQGLNALLKAKRQELRKPLDLAELESAGSLKAAVAKLEERRTAWVQEATIILQSTNITFNRWQSVVEALSQGKDPELDREEEDKLVQARLLKRTLSLGG
jgi:hypothetical protein